MGHQSDSGFRPRVEQSPKTTKIKKKSIFPKDWRKQAECHCYIHGPMAIPARINTSPILAGAHSASRADWDLAKCRQKCIHVPQTIILARQYFGMFLIRFNNNFMTTTAICVCVLGFELHQYVFSHKVHPRVNELLLHFEIPALIL
ncbi:hypothetical protein ElyMa_005524400 [Elysia marginata]|uniref:Uncharacterized protein n=1 Tax=Elysia marginata TaxID=1093978 RepID=A0AAV4EVW5_9GAST|nr:hypothetical protein ElyMa_005524400 [Elysia marginata]